MTASVTRPPLSANEAAPSGIFSHRLCRAAALPLFLLLSDCSHGSGPHPTASGSELFSEAYADIAQYYIDPVTPQALALAGLRKLSSLDPGFAVEIAAGEVILRERGSERRLLAPPPHEAAAWGALTATALDAGRQLSPALGGLAEDRLRET